MAEPSVQAPVGGAFGAEAAGSRPVAQVMLDSALPQLDHLFDYAVPEHLAPIAFVGQRVRVPLRGSRTTFGYIVGFSEQSDFAGDLSPIAEIVSEVPVLSPDVWRLARAVADRAGGSASDILRLAIPTRQVRVEKKHLAGMSETPALGEASAPEPLLAESADTPNTAQRLVDGDRLSVLASHSPVRLDTGEWIGRWAEEMARVALGVYELGRSVIIATPDYRDLDQVRDALEALGHAETIRVDARQSNAERYVAFLRTLDRAPRIVLGNRSAVYAPAHALGAILLWDDGDPVLSEPLSPYVHARDAALVRAEQSGAGLFFAAHSRSAEVQRLVDLGYVHPQLYPPKRTRAVHADASLAPDAFAGRVPDFAARAIREGLKDGPVLVQVATPGYAPISVCSSCGDLARCLACAGPIGFRSAGQPACRWCGQLAAQWRCAHCGERELSVRGAGSQRTVQQFEQQFAGVRVLLSDGEHPRERIDARSALVVATRGAEPIAAGGYRAVVLLDVERLLSIESLRAGEDCLRWWENAAALAAPDGRCIVASGGGPVVQAFLTGRSEEWLRHELRDRHQLRYPPAVRVASVTGGVLEVDRALDTLSDLPGIDVLGPTPMPGSSRVRAIVRFEYARGAEIAKRLRGALVADAAGSASRGRGGARPGALRLRFDDRGVFDSDPPPGTMV